MFPAFFALLRCLAIKSLLGSSFGGGCFTDVALVNEFVIFVLIIALVVVLWGGDLFDRWLSPLRGGVSCRAFGSRRHRLFLLSDLTFGCFSFRRKASVVTRNRLASRKINLLLLLRLRSVLRLGGRSLQISWLPTRLCLCFGARGTHLSSDTDSFNKEKKFFS